MTKTQGNIAYNRDKRSVFFPAGDHKAARVRPDSMTDKLKKPKKDPQRKHLLGTVSKKITGGLKHVRSYQPHPYFNCELRQIHV